MFRFCRGHAREICHHHDIVTGTAVLPSVVSQCLIAVIQLEHVEVLARQAPLFPSRLRLRAIKSRYIWTIPLKFASSARLKSMLVGVLKPKGRVSSLS